MTAGTRIVLLLTGLFLILSPGLARAQEESERIAAARATVQSFAKDLKGQLVTAMKAEGPIAAIGVCQIAAPEIAAAKSAETDGEVGRTSLKLRNPANAPDAWEEHILLDFEARKTAGADPAKLESYTTVQEEGRSYFRYMKAIPTGKPCLACHGTDIDPKVIEKLDALYPEDQARGFALGDIRGAFTIKQPL